MVAGYRVLAARASGGRDPLISQQQHTTGVPRLQETHAPRTLPYAYAWGPRGVLGGWTISYGLGTLV